MRKNSHGQNNASRTVCARSAAVNALMRFESRGSYSNIELDVFLKSADLSSEDKRLFTLIFYGVIENRIFLDHVISSMTDIKRLSPKILCVLRSAFYQLIFTDKIPPYAAVNEACGEARSDGRGAVSLVNAVLRNFLRTYPEHGKDALVRDMGINDRSVVYSCSKDVISVLDAGYGREKADSVLKSFETKPGLSAVVNTSVISARDFITGLSEKGIECFSPEGFDDLVYIPCGANPAELPGFEKGSCFIQDLSSHAAVRALLPEEGDTLIDVCACPGGKTFASALMMNGRGRIISLDVHKNKLSLITGGCKRLGIDFAEVRRCDALSPLTEFFGTADKVICDVPCSGLGVIAKKPEIRYKTKNDIASLPALQREILEKSAAYLKTGGKLMYSTCTLNPEENDGVTNGFLAAHDDFVRVSGKESGVTLFPDEAREKYGAPHDGFFYDILMKIK